MYGLDCVFTLSYPNFNSFWYSWYSGSILGFKVENEIRNGLWLIISVKPKIITKTYHNRKTAIFKMFYIRSSLEWTELTEHYKAA